MSQPSAIFPNRLQYRNLTVLNHVSIPVINIPTTLSGGEYSDLAGGTDTRTRHKVLFTHPSMLAQLVIIDPALNISTPKRTWLSTGIRAVDRCVEGLCSLDSKAGPETGRVLTAGLKLLVPSLLLTKRNWENEQNEIGFDARCCGEYERCKFGTANGWKSWHPTSTWTFKCWAGETSCVMLPAVLRYKAQHGDEKVRARQQQVLDILWNQDTVAEVLKRKGLEKQMSMRET